MVLRFIYICIAAIYIAALCSGSAMAATFDLNVSDESVQAKYGHLVGGSTYGRTELTYGVLYHDDNDKEGMAELGLQVVDKAGTKMPGLELGIGPKIYVAGSDQSDTDAVAVGLGGQLRYKHQPLSRLVFGLALYYAPGIVSFEDAKKMYETNANVAYEILPTANVYLAHRTIRYDLKLGKEETIDDGVNVGMQFRF